MRILGFSEDLGLKKDFWGTVRTLGFLEDFWEFHNDLKGTHEGKGQGEALEKRE